MSASGGHAKSFLRIARTQGKVARVDSKIEALFSQQLRVDRAPDWDRNFKFLAPERDLELDFAWPRIKFAVEVQGAVHRITERFHADREKHALAILADWTILPVTGRHVRDGRAIQWAMEILRRRMP
jgi:very-short-patch-repair endonuclease